MRETIDKRPLLWLAMAFAFGLCFRVAPWGVLFALPLLMLVSSWGRRGFVVLAVLVGMAMSPGKALPLEPGSFATLDLEIASVPRLDPQNRSLALANSPYGLIRLRAPYGTSLSLGEQVRAHGAHLAYLPGENWRLRGVRGQVSAERLEKVGEGPFWFRWGVLWRESFQRYTRETMPEQAATLDALCFNVDAALDPDLKDDLKRAGAIHIVSASGLHVTLFALALQFAFSRVPVPRPVQILLLLLILGLYAGAAGLRPPVFRAVAMAGLAMPAYLAKREPDTLSALGAAALIQLAFDPTAIWDLGFQLSYALVLILGLYPVYERSRSPLGWVRQSARVSGVATLAATPLTAHYFGYVSIVGAMSNLLIAPLLLPLMVASLLGWLIWTIQPALAQPFAWLSGFLAEGLAFIAESFGRLPFAAFEVGHFDAWWILVGYAGGLLLWRPSYRPPPESISDP